MSTLCAAVSALMARWQAPMPPVAGKAQRSVDRICRLLGLLYPWKDVVAARYAIERGDARDCAAALEYLDNMLSSSLRKKVIPVLLRSAMQFQSLSMRIPRGRSGCSFAAAS